MCDADRDPGDVGEKGACALNIVFGVVQSNAGWAFLRSTRRKSIIDAEWCLVLPTMLLMLSILLQVLCEANARSCHC